ncbi:hypothetical protein GCM10009830_01340 [Glycomyces endophyticus]|uniref:Uncharacterized protein n=1 Tax=Glycomyces endophyticus TaxID=480996 RepID=A0ABN2FUP5_9ACTN
MKSSVATLSGALTSIVLNDMVPSLWSADVKGTGAKPCIVHLGVGRADGAILSRAPIEGTRPRVAEV